MENDFPVVAEHLLNFCLSSFDNEVYFIDVPDLNSEATDLIYKYNGHYFDYFNTF